MQKTLLSVAVVAAILLAACGGKESPIPAVDCTGVSPTYTNAVKDIFDNSCATGGCHDAATKESGYDLSDYAGSKAASTKDNLLGSINHTSGFEAMPKGSAKLSDAEIKIITCWVDSGAPQ